MTLTGDFWPKTTKNEVAEVCSFLAFWPEKFSKFSFLTGKWKAGQNGEIFALKIFKNFYFFQKAEKFLGQND